MTVLKGQKNPVILNTKKKVTVLLNLVIGLSTFGCVFLNVHVFNTFIFQRAPIFKKKIPLSLEASDGLSWIRRVILWTEWGKPMPADGKRVCRARSLGLLPAGRLRAGFGSLAAALCVHFPRAQETS